MKLLRAENWAMNVLVPLNIRLRSRCHASFRRASENLKTKTSFSYASDFIFTILTSIFMFTCLKL